MAGTEAQFLNRNRERDLNMSLQDIVRQETHDIRDALKQIDERRGERLRKKKAAEERLKRSGTEITKHREREKERKRLLQQADAKVKESQEVVAELDREREELERRASEANNRLMKERDARVETQKLLKQAQQAIEQGQGDFQGERSSIRKSEAEIEQAEKDKTRQEERLREALVASLDIHLKELAAGVEQAFVGEEERQKKLAAFEAFKNARHKDRKIGDLCDQRDELRKMVNTATVPGVKEMLQDSLRRIEDELEELYPGALGVVSPPSDRGHIEELHYYRADSGEAVFLLPITQSAWKAVERGDQGAAATVATRLIWDIIKGLGLTKEKGEFSFDGRWCVFSSKLDFEEVTELYEGFNVSLPGAVTLDVILYPLPPEIQEAVTYEAVHP